MMALLHSTRLYKTLPLLYLTLLDSTYLYHGSTSFYYSLHNSKNGSTSLYFTLHYSTMAILKSTRLYIDLPWLYFTVLDYT